MILSFLLLLSRGALSLDFEQGPTIYSIYRAVDLGPPAETPPKDYYINVGTNQGLQNGSVLDVYRRLPSYDIKNEKLYQDVTVPIAVIKIIHVEKNISIARLDKMLPIEKTVSLTPASILIGDLVKKPLK
jgi:hypothetical protein